MPYIEEDYRTKFAPMLDICPEIDNKGELEYVIFSLMMKYMSNKEPRYTELHNCVYATMHCADEYRRRYLDVREDAARAKNGDIS